jgi:hypothetical protein
MDRGKDVNAWKVVGSRLTGGKGQRKKPPRKNPLPREMACQATVWNNAKKGTIPERRFFSAGSSLEKR